MKVAALYHQEVMDEDGASERTVHSIVHDGGAFAVSSVEVGIALQNFLNNATADDIMHLHTHLLFAYEQARK